MSRNVSDEFYEAVFDQETDQAFLILLTLDSPEMTSPIRVTSDGVDTESNGNTYIAFPFSINLHDQDSEQIPKVKIAIDAVDRRVVEELRNTRDPITVTMEVVLSRDPDTVEVGPIDYTLRNVTVTTQVIEGTLKFGQFQNVNFPSGTFNPIDFPGLF